jgi:two-component system, NtrC family, response regulator GlrR
LSLRRTASADRGRGFDPPTHKISRRAGSILAVVDRTIPSVSEAAPSGDETKVQAAFALSPSQAPPKAATLRWTDAAGQHTRHLEGSLVLGSAPGNGIVIPDRLVSRIHAELELRSDGLWVRDLGSRNGTYVDRLLVRSARIPSGSHLVVGETSIHVVQEADGPAIDLWPNDRFGSLVGRSTPMRALFAQLASVARLDCSVLILGQTGTGKELVARSIHEASSRARGPFVVVDCGALPETLLDDELFGHVKGAFTGADTNRLGALESANGGTVFLDEIGELPLSMQPRLLRALEQRTVRRIGESTHHAVDVRFLAATHRDLPAIVNAREFREDLYFRLAVVPVNVPPLSERPEDIAVLIEHFLPASASKPSPDLLRELERHCWRGNVRELRNFVERALALGPARALDSLPSASGSPTFPEPPTKPRAKTTSIPPSPGGAISFEQELRSFREAWGNYGEREYLRRLLKRHARNVSAAAREAGVDRTYVHRLMRKHEV